LKEELIFSNSYLRSNNLYKSNQNNLRKEKNKKNNRLPSQIRRKEKFSVKILELNIKKRQDNRQQQPSRKSQQLKKLKTLQKSKQNYQKEIQ